MIVGSFRGVAIEAAPDDVRRAFADHRCPDCGDRVRWYDDVATLRRIIECGPCGKRVEIEPSAPESMRMAIAWARWCGALPAPGERMPGTLG